MVDIAQLARAPDCGSGGHRFNSDYPPHFNFSIGVSPSGKAMDFDSIIRWFESSHPSHIFINFINEPLAQLVEHLTFNPVVRGSSPRWLTIILRIFWYKWNLSITEVFSCLDINFVFEISDFFDLFKSQTLKKWNPRCEVSFSYKFSSGGCILSHGYGLIQYLLESLYRGWIGKYKLI